MLMLLQAASVILLLCHVTNCQETTECNMEFARQCLDKAENSIVPSGCNWYILVGPLQACMDIATAGCTYLQQQEWDQLVRDFNTTLQTDECNPQCTQQSLRAADVLGCFDTAIYETRVKDILADEAPTLGQGDANCLALANMRACLIPPITGCPALQDVTYARATSVSGAATAFTKCGLPFFQRSSTSAPIQILDTNSMTYPPSTTPAGDGEVNIGQLILLILGSAVILASIIAIIVVIALTIRRRRNYRRSILRDWRPNGQKVYYDDPPVLSRPNIKTYRPTSMPDESLNEQYFVR